MALIKYNKRLRLVATEMLIESLSVCVFVCLFFSRHRHWWWANQASRPAHRDAVSVLSDNNDAGFLLASGGSGISHDLAAPRPGVNCHCV